MPWMEVGLWASFAVNMLCTASWVIRHRQRDRTARVRMERWLRMEQEQQVRWREEWARLEAVRAWLWEQDEVC